jgi:hypothetical protein
VRWLLEDARQIPFQTAKSIASIPDISNRSKQPGFCLATVRSSERT